MPPYPCFVALFELQEVVDPTNAKSTTRLYMTRKAQPWHVDASDLVCECRGAPRSQMLSFIAMQCLLRACRPAHCGKLPTSSPLFCTLSSHLSLALLFLKTAKSGGLSGWASSSTIYNEILRCVAAHAMGPSSHLAAPAVFPGTACCAGMVQTLTAHNLERPAALRGGWKHLTHHNTWVAPSQGLESRSLPIFPAANSRTRPDLIPVLAGTWYMDRKKEVPPGKKPYFVLPILNWHEVRRGGEVVHANHPSRSRQVR
jgi:hypothetical protein